MLAIDKNIKLSYTDRVYLHQLIKAQWQEAGRRFLRSFIFPLSGVIVLSIFIEVLALGVPLTDILFAGSIGGFLLHLGLLFFLSIPVFLVALAVNVAMVLMKLPMLYADLAGNRKTRIAFHPTAYTMPGSGQYFIQTGIPNNLYIQVKLETFLFINPEQVLIFETTPRSNTFLGIKTPYELQVPELEHITIS